MCLGTDPASPSKGDGVLPPNAVSYRRIDTDGSTQICGVYFLKGLALNDDHLTMDKPVPPVAVLPTCMTNAALESLNSLSNTALHQVDEVGNMSFVGTAVQQLYSSLEHLVRTSQELFKQLVQERAQRRAYEREVASSPIMAEKLLETFDREKGVLKRRISLLEKTASDLAQLLPPPLFSRPGRKVQSASGLLKMTARDELKAEERAQLAEEEKRETDKIPTEGEVEEQPHAAGRQRKEHGARYAQNSAEACSIRSPTAAVVLSTQYRPATPFASYLTHSLCTQDAMSEKFASLDTAGAGFLTFQIVTEFYRSIDSYGVPRGEERLQEFLKKCNERNTAIESGRVYYKGMEGRRGWGEVFGV